MDAFSLVALREAGVVLRHPEWGRNNWKKLAPYQETFPSYHLFTACTDTDCKFPDPKVNRLTDITNFSSATKMQRHLDFRLQLRRESLPCPILATFYTILIPSRVSWPAESFWFWNYNVFVCKTLQLTSVPLIVDIHRMSLGGSPSDEYKNSTETHTLTHTGKAGLEVWVLPTESPSYLEAYIWLNMNNFNNVPV